MILGLQYSEGDFSRSMKLARFLADLEPHYRTDVILALVRDSSFSPPVAEVEAVAEHCSRKFPVELVILPQADRGWPRGPNRQWSGMMEHFAAQRENSRDGRFNSIFVFDGGDGIPLHRQWINLLITEHKRTLDFGKLITGTIGIDTTNRFHINGNVLLETKIWNLCPEIHDCPDHDSWDCYHFQTFAPRTSLSTVIRNDWKCQARPSVELLSTFAQESLWWHGCKHEDLHDVAREFLTNSSIQQPVLKRWSSFKDYKPRPGIRHKPWVNGHSVSVVTGCMNRREFLVKALPTWTRSAVPNEILIVDWSSSESLEKLVEEDPRIVVVRVTDQKFWHNSKCHNLEFRLARGGIVLHLDSDYLLGPHFFQKHPLSASSFFYAGNWKKHLLSDKKSLTGLLYVHRNQLFEVNGYNEHLNEYGHEDDDLFDRLSATGLRRMDLDYETLDHIPHSDVHRYENLRIGREVPRLYQEALDGMSLFEQEVLNPNERALLIGRSERIRKEHPWTTDDRMTRWAVKPVGERYYECEEVRTDVGERGAPWKMIA